MNSAETIVASILGAGAVWQLVYWLWIMTRVRRGPRDIGSELQPVSIIICARNEEDNLRRLIPSLLSQKYAADKQIVIVDDCSTDDTPLVIAQMRAEHPEIYTTTIPVDSKFKHGKKLAITVGIKAARFEHLIFIDADCWPETDNWLTSVMEHYADSDKQMVLGYGRYAKRPGLLNLLIRYEAFWNAVQYMGFCKALRPFMGVGRNLSYTKSLFDSSSKFRNNLKVLSGDDDMFVSEMGTRKNTAINFIREGQTVTEAKSNWMDYAAQKTRHLTTASLYPFSIKLMLGLELMTRVLFWLGLVAVGLLMYLGWTSSDILPMAAGGVLLVRTIIMYVDMGISAHNMSESRMWLLALPLDIVIPIMQAFAWITGKLTQRSDKWK